MPIDKTKKRGFGTRLKRRVKLIYLKTVRLDDPPERIARGAAIGVFMGIFPTFGAGVPLSILAAFLLRANKAAAVIGSLIMNPFTSPFFWTLSAAAGSLILRQDSQRIISELKSGHAMAGNIGRAYLVFMAGNIVVSASSAAAAYYLVKRAVIRHRLKKARRRAAG